MSTDRDRPTYHLLPSEGLCHDPCGAIFWQGRHHLFFLHGTWADSGPKYRADGYEYKAWAHVSSADLIHWRRHPNAIDCGQTGELFLFNGMPTIIYPDPDRGGATCIATNRDGDLGRWDPHPGNPVLRDPLQGDRDHGRATRRGRDVTAWQEGAWCYALTGTVDTENGGDTLHLFRSRDLAHWEFVHRFFQSERRWTGVDEDCSCPSLFRLGSKWMLLCFSHARKARYYLGRYADQRFYPETHDRINWIGGNVHAPRTILDSQGRRLLFLSLNEGRVRSTCEAAGWAQTLSMPVAISLAPDGTAIRYAPAPELEALRRDSLEVRDVRVEPDSDVVLPDVRGDCMELDVEIEPQGARECGLMVRCASDGSEITTIALSEPRAGADGQTIRIDYHQSSLRTDLAYPFTGSWRRGENQQFPRIQETTYGFRQGECVRLRVFLDHSVLELFADDRRYLAQRVFPTRPDSLGVTLFSRGGPTVVTRLRAWQMSPISAG